MDVLNKFCSTVHTTVSHLSGVLPGNNVTREYEVLDQVCTAGIGLSWKVFNGYKKSTKQEVSVFVFEKKTLERWSKDDRETVLETLRRGVQQLTKIRHPHVLTVQHPLEESRDCLAFATEPVFASLANVIGEHVKSDKKLYDVEIRHGLLQLIDGLMFLHSDAKILHHNICIETIIINKNRSWKLFGFDFCILNQPTADGQPYWPYKEFSNAVHILAQPSLEYYAPELALNNVINTDSDLFSLGVLIFTIYAGKPLKMFGNDYSSFRRYANDLNQRKYPSMSAVPSEMIESLKAILHPSPHMRPRLHEFKQIAYFQDVGVKTMSYLDSLYQWDNLQKSKFYKGLPQIIPTLPHRVNLHSILPHLIKEFVNSPMIPFVLPNVLLIAEMSSQREYCEHILPHLRAIFRLTDPIQILLIFMQKMDLLLKLTPPDEVKMHVFPLLYRSLECDMPQLQELCLAVLPTFSTLIDYNAMKNALIPRIKKLCLNSSNVSVKVNCLISIGKLLENLDKWLVLDEILPFLQQIQSREPAIVMAIIGIYKTAMTNTKLGITKDVMAHKCIPFLMPLCVENGLTVAQFNTILALVKEMVSRVEKEQREKLEQLSTIQRDNKPKDAAEILVTELEKGSAIMNSGNNNKSDEIFHGFSADATAATVGQTVNQMKTQNGPKPTNNILKITHKTDDDILTTLMNRNLNNVSRSTTNANNAASLTLQSVANSNSSSSSNNDAWTATWQSANPLVMNHHLATPQSHPNNNFAALADFDPFSDGAINASSKKAITAAANTNTFGRPSIGNSVYANSSNSGRNANDVSTKKALTLTPQQAQQNHANDKKTFNVLSQQDILNFLN